MTEKKGRSALFSLIVAILIIVFVQILLVGGAIYASHVIPTLCDNAYENFQQIVKNRKNYIERELYNRWSQIDDSADMISSMYPETLDGGSLSKEEVVDFLKSSAEPLMSTLRDTGTTGSFLILNDNLTPDSAHSCLYFIDGDPDYNDIKNNSDLLILKGPLEFLNEFKIPLHISWNYGITLNEDNRDIFYKPYNAALEGNDSKYLGYWNISPSLYDDNADTITYTRPLISPSGDVFGVIGVEIAQEYIFKLLPDTELTNSRSNGYAIVADSKEGGIEPIMVQGATMRKILPTGQKIKMTLENEAFDGYSFKAEGNPIYALNYQKIELYNNNTPFSDRSWYLMGLTNEEILIKNSKDLTHALILAIAGSLCVGVVFSIVLSFFFTKPLQEMVMQIRLFVPGQKLKLGSTGIAEIDVLSRAVEQLNVDVLNSVLKTDKIIDMMNLDIGSYEYKSRNELVKISPVLANMLLLTADEYGYVSQKEFAACLDEIKKNKEREGIYKYGIHSDKWLKLENVSTENGEFGIVVDVTKEELAHISLKHDRDYDALTDIYNRFAFWRKLEELFKANDFKCAAFMMGDLDNLKHLNDTYGHDTGDSYIKATANFLRRYFTDKLAIYGRMSGDEFYSFIYGYESIEETRKIVLGLHLALSNEFITLPDNTTFRLKMSSGVAWYPLNDKEPETLFRYADFAMYQGKKSIKGSIREFDIKLYEEQSYMFTGKEELNNILDKQLLEYVFQPIISAVDGHVYGYEALMRPGGKTINTPDKLLRLAKTEGQLWKVEKNTFYMVMGFAERYNGLLNECKLFLNSVPNQLLKEREYDELNYLYKDILKNIVVEITENESIDDYSLQKKKSFVREWGAQLAVDDYGSGYANDMLLLNLQPEFIKIDRFMVDGVDTDNNKLDIVKKTIAFAKERNIAVIGEGVETEAEFTTLLAAGADYIQGYFVAKPMPIPDFDCSEIMATIKRIRKENKAD